MAEITPTMMDQDAADEELAGVSMMALLELEGNFLGLYDAMLRKVQDADAKTQLRTFRGDHEGHVESLTRVLREDLALATWKPQPTEFGRELVRRVDATKDDEALMGLYFVNEDFSRRTYFAISQNDMPEPVARVIEAALDDEEKHYAWAAEFLGVEFEDEDELE